MTQLLDGEVLVPLRVGVLPGVLGVDGVHGGGVHDASGAHLLREHGGDGVGGVPGRGPAHDGDLHLARHGGGLLHGGTYVHRGAVPKCQREKFGVDPGGVDTHDVELVLGTAEGPAGDRVVPCDLPAAADHGDVHFLRDPSSAILGPDVPM
jgi:hypothetical protein